MSRCEQRCPVMKMAVLVLFATIGCGCSPPVDASADMAQPQALGPVVLSAPLAGSLGEHEPTILATPQGRVALAWVSSVSSGYQVYYRLSTDRGTSFADAVAIPFPPGTNVCSNTSMTFTGDGSIHLSFGCEKRTTGPRSSQGVFVARSPAATLAFEPAVAVTDSASMRTIDQPHIAATREDELIVVYAEANATDTGDELEGARSSDGGATWIRMIVPAMAGTTTRGWPRVVASRTDARVWLAAFDDGLGASLRWSDDGGRTWPVADQRAIPDAADLAQNLSSDLQLAVDGQDVWVLYGLSQDSGGTGGFTNNYKDTHLRLAHSTDGGATLSTRNDIEDAATGRFFMLPNLVRDEAGGLNLTYYAGAAEGDAMATYRLARSVDGGQRFAPSVAIGRPVVFDTSRGTTRWLGDYQGLSAAERAIYVAYVDDADATPHVSFYRAPLP